MKELSMIISIFTPHGGCPERCHFCDQSVSGGSPVSKTRIVQTIEAHLTTYQTAKKNSLIEVAFYGGTFTAMRKSLQIEYLSSVLPYLQKKIIDSVRLSTRPDALDQTWLRFLQNEYYVRTIELGAQSFNPRVLSALGRTHRVESIESGVVLLKKLGFKVGLHLMVGCPQEDASDDTLNVEKLCTLKPDMVRIHPLLVLRNTELHKMWINKEFEPIDLETAVARCAAMTKHLEKAGIKVIRLGLQTNELLNDAVVAGPYHPSFGDLVRKQVDLCQ